MASLAQPIGPNGRKGLSWDIFFPAIVLGVVGVFFWPAASKHTRKTLAGSVGSRSVLDSPQAQFSCSLLSSQNVTSTGLNYSPRQSRSRPNTVAHVETVEARRQFA